MFEYEVKLNQSVYDVMVLIRMAPIGSHIFNYLVSSWWNCLRKIKNHVIICGFEVSKDP